MFKKAAIAARQKLKSLGKNNGSVFDDVYRNKLWRGEGEISSGLGSSPANSKSYEDLIVAYIEANDIRSMVDIGCGDHQVSHRILQRVSRPITYTGLDVSSVAIEHNRQKYGTENVSFICADAASSDLPEADLVTVREVLQHIPNADIAKILPKLKEFEHAVITNTVARNARNYNVDIAPGAASRAALGSGLLLDLPPFNCNVEVIDRKPHDDHPTEIITVRLLD